MDDQEEIASPDPEALFLGACSLELAIGGVGLLLGLALGVDGRAYLPRLEEISANALAKEIGIGFLAAIPMAIVVYGIMKIPHPSIEAIKQLGNDPMMKSLLSLGFLELFIVSLCAGVGEEIAFRGCLLPLMAGIADAAPADAYEMSRSLSNAPPELIVSAVLFSSVAFGLLHRMTRLYIVLASVMGVYFAVLLIATDSLMVPIVAHTVYNTSQFWQAKRESMKEAAIANTASS